MSSTILGVVEALAWLRELQASVQAAGDTSVEIGVDESQAPYGWGMEFGEYRNGRLARRAGGAFYLTGAFQAVAPMVADAIAEALPRGPEAVRQAILAKGQQVLGLAQEKVPVLTGNLRQSLYAAEGGRAA